MGASSIDISQYRSRIGTFTRNKLRNSKTASSGNDLKTNTLMESLIMLSYLLVMSNVTQHLLIMSGVELNPGPFPLDPKASDKSKKQMQSDAKAEKQQQASGSGLASLPTSYQVATAPTRIHPRIDATDRRQIEAQNEDRSHTTKETLDDIKRIHYKEKKKKEQNCNSEPYQTEIQLGGWSATGAGKTNADTYAWDPKYAMSLKNANKNKKQHEASSATFRDGGNGSEGNKRTMGSKESEARTQAINLGSPGKPKYVTTLTGRNSPKKTSDPSKGSTKPNKKSLKVASDQPSSDVNSIHRATQIPGDHGGKGLTEWPLPFTNTRPGISCTPMQHVGFEMGFQDTDIIRILKDSNSLDDALNQMDQEAAHSSTNMPAFLPQDFQYPKNDEQGDLDGGTDQHLPISQNASECLENAYFTAEDDEADEDEPEILYQKTKQVTISTPNEEIKHDPIETNDPNSSSKAVVTSVVDVPSDKSSDGDQIEVIDLVEEDSEDDYGFDYGFEDDSMLNDPVSSTLEGNEGPGSQQQNDSPSPSCSSTVSKEQQKMELFWKLMDMGFTRERTVEAVHEKGFTEVALAADYLLSTPIFEGYSVEKYAPKEHEFYKKPFSAHDQSQFSKAVLREANLLRSSLPDGIYVRAFEDRMDLFSIMIRGPEKTPYEDGLFFFDVQLSPSYPQQPPKFHYHSFSKRMNPNLYVNGKVCVSLLGTWMGQGSENWDPKNSNLLQVLISIQGLILVNEPYFNEPGFSDQQGTQRGAKESRIYNEMVLIENVTSLTKIAENPPPLFLNDVLEHLNERMGVLSRRLESWVETEDPRTQLNHNESTYLPDFPLAPVSPQFKSNIKRSLKDFNKAVQKLLNKDGLMNKTAEH